MVSHFYPEGKLPFIRDLIELDFYGNPSLDVFSGRIIRESHGCMFACLLPTFPVSLMVLPTVSHHPGMMIIHEMHEHAPLEYETNGHDYADEQPNSHLHLPSPQWLIPMMNNYLRHGYGVNC